MNWQSPHRFIFPYLLEIAISVHSDQVMRWGTGWWQREGRQRKRKWDIVLGDVRGGGLKPPEFTPSGRQVTVQRGQWTRVPAEARWYSSSHQSGLREALILNILWLFQAQKDYKTDLAHLEACTHWRSGCKNRQEGRNSHKVTKYINTYEWAIAFHYHFYYNYYYWEEFSVNFLKIFSIHYFCSIVFCFFFLLHHSLVTCLRLQHFSLTCLQWTWQKCKWFIQTFFKIHTILEIWIHEQLSQISHCWTGETKIKQKKKSSQSCQWSLKMIYTQCVDTFLKKRSGLDWWDSVNESCRTWCAFLFFIAESHHTSSNDTNRKIMGCFFTQPLLKGGI